MYRILHPVGRNAINRYEDVKVVQFLLNKHQPTLLKVDGIMGIKTYRSIKLFQEKNLDKKYQDSRIDPNGKTIKLLEAIRQGNQPNEKNEHPRKKNHSNLAKLRKKYVSSAVQELDITTKIIDKLLIDMEGINFKIISGYLSDSDQFWKVNYHYDYLMWMLNHSLMLNLKVKDKSSLQSIKSKLERHVPKPARGYRNSSIGKPEDKSSHEKIQKRFHILKLSKREFKAQIEKLDLKSKSNRSNKTFDLSVAPISFPGSSKHGTGYALDISGDRGLIKSRCKALNASLIFDEKSHVHIEFQNFL